MKKFRVSYLFFTASIIFFIDAIVGSFNGGELALDHITMGSALLCIGCGLESSKRKKAKKNEKTPWKMRM